MKITELPAKPKEEKIIRVAAYARVSSDKDAAFHSLTAQREYYEEYIASRPNWRLVSIYSDNGISGTTINRPEFQRMLKDCREGKIDLVVTKSVTRFARNTVILLETIRELKALDIDVYFEKEDMHSISPDGELLLTLLAMYAEEEARSASENQLWRVRKKFEKGEPWTGNMLGYRLVDGKLVIVPEEAEIVRQIYTDYLSGMGTERIAKNLTLQGIPPRRGQIWGHTVVRSILKNEKYVGNMILQKTYRKDFRVKRGTINKGERRKYYVENSHEAIIDPETFAKVQAEMERRAEMNPRPTSPVGRERSLFSGLIQCGCCGRRFVHHKGREKYKENAFWACPTYYKKGRLLCPSQKIPDYVLIEKTEEVLSVDELSREILQERIKKIIVPEHNHLQFILKDGTWIDAEWHHRSRSESWTSEMRKAAAKRAKAQFQKED